MNIVITGAAGFIGSSLSEALLKQGHKVKGIDCLGQNHNDKIKRANLNKLLIDPAFQWLNVNLLQADLNECMEEAEVVFHLAGIAGVRNSWGNSFEDYVNTNILLTQKILEACKQAPKLKKLVYASSRLHQC